MNLRFAIACFLILFGTVEGIQWLSHLSLPLPFFMVGGFALAVLSNADKLPIEKLPWAGVRAWLSTPFPQNGSRPIDPE